MGVSLFLAQCAEKVFFFSKLKNLSVLLIIILYDLTFPSEHYGGGGRSSWRAQGTWSRPSSFTKPHRTSSPWSASTATVGTWKR